MVATLLEFTNELLAHDADSDTTEELDIASGPGKILSVNVDNSANAAACYLDVYNARTADVSADEPELRIMVAGSSGVGGGDVHVDFAQKDGASEGLIFDTGISYGCTTSNDGTGDPASSTLVTLRFVKEA